MKDMDTTPVENIPEDGGMRDFGEQPIALIMRRAGLTNHDVVAASARPITHKMVMRACRGRKLTHHTKMLVQDALNRALGAQYALFELFTY